MMRRQRWYAEEPISLSRGYASLHDLFPQRPGCYAIYCDGILSYIGQTTNLYKRIYSYNFRVGFSPMIITPWGSFNHVLVKFRVPRVYGEWAMTELRLIRRLQPKFNCVGSVKKRRANA
jgi:excinuclease UvrABC nuclease subunit